MPTDAPPFGPQPPPTTPVPPSAPAPPHVADDDDDQRTVAIGADVARFKIPTSLMTLQIRDREGVWHAWTTIGASGVKVGRPSDKATKFPELSSLATRHVRISVEGPKLRVEDLGAINGVYRKLSRSVELEDGMRFRVGARVVEFYRAEPEPPVEERVTEDGEIFWSQDLQPVAFLQFLRPDGGPGLRYPITKPDVTILGRETRPGRPVDIALTNDGIASGTHAQIRRDGERFWLEDLNSRNGTFVQIKGQAHIEPGEELLVGRVLLRAVDAMHAPGS